MADAPHKRPTLTLMCGLPGSGKSTWAAAHAATSGARVHTADAMRLGTCSAAHAFERLRSSVARDMRLGRNVIVDVCALREQDRREWLTVARLRGYTTRLVILTTPYAECVRRNLSRPANERAVIDWNRARVNLAHAVANARREGWGSVTSARA